MSSIARYLYKQNYKPKLIHPISNALQIVVVIPCKNENNILSTLNSLEIAAKGLFNIIEVIVVVNDHDEDSESVYHQNLLTENLISQYDSRLKVHSIYLNKVLKKKSGVGFARKAGMDEAVYRLDKVNQSNGILCSMDADTVVEENYFREIVKEFEYIQKDCLVINYTHSTEGLDEKQKEAIEAYELHLRYYEAALRWAGFPHAFQTLGSAIAVKASAYAALGGMPARQAGEDFYFIHKFSKIDQVTELNTTTVHPSARVSERVPFGTGKAIGDLMTGKVEWGMTYPWQAFEQLRTFLDQIHTIYEVGMEAISISSCMTHFLNAIGFEKILSELKLNTTGFDTFKKRFWQKMDAFMMMKYVHFVRDNYFGMEKVNIATHKLFTELNIPPPTTIYQQLKILREYKAAKNPSH